VNLLVACLIIGLSLLGGIWGYEHFEGLRLREAFLNSAMLLGGMGRSRPISVLAARSSRDSTPSIPDWSSS
jgi:hypothetical protein